LAIPSSLWSDRLMGGEYTDRAGIDRFAFIFSIWNSDI